MYGAALDLYWRPDKKKGEPFTKIKKKEQYKWKRNLAVIGVHKTYKYSSICSWRQLRFLLNFLILDTS